MVAMAENRHTTRHITSTQYWKKLVSPHAINRVTFRLAEEPTDTHSGSLGTEEWIDIVDQCLGTGRKAYHLDLKASDRWELSCRIASHIRRHGGTCRISCENPPQTKGPIQLLRDSGVHLLSIPIYGPASIHDGIIGRKGAFKQMINGLGLFFDERRKGHTDIPGIEVKALIGAHNAAHLGHLVTSVGSIGVHQVRFQVVTETPLRAVEATVLNGQKIAENIYTPQSESLLPSKADIKQIRLQLALVSSGRYGIPVRSRVVRALRDEHLTRGEFPIKECRYVRSALEFKPDGDVVPCAYFKYAFGNARSEPLESILSGDRRALFTRTLSRGFFPICRHCCNYEYNLTLRQHSQMAFVGRL